jgi:hypothetical protein
MGFACDQKRGQGVKNRLLKEKTPDAGGGIRGLSAQVPNDYLPFGFPGAEGFPGLAAGFAAGLDAGFSVCDFIALLSDGQCRLCPQTPKRHAPACLKYVGLRHRAIPSGVNILLAGDRCDTAPASRQRRRARMTFDLRPLK